ncbi:MAG: TolB family protein, partial [Candidatus Acidiferrum sp.]
MVTNRKFAVLALAGGLLLLILVSRASYGGSSLFQIRSVAPSPDGKLIAIGVAKAGTSFIYTVAVATGEAKRLTTAESGEETFPTFSPDGKRIAYTYWPGKE